ncbi:hypothetical protein A2973_03060 [Candidatus Gottesmanbacteria bacterium RIFCSPLOWO2_01_FULL_49_10]|uniref:Uncharacterized protein n=1 Tax=Candidatus Gottesmanbacteria bacterium RIFCSPLOWO2_01_FULL_49_10 TaxID=1798396 RepID=A0A1F6B1C2_9BACT|nr:MAG: PilA1 [Microgenomates group bacterium GW2011_GWA2_47_8]OGG30725.1 MAG: hypothetical protein A2973_03060 [Candidatus Gottesmanbacteria bacterium RIFCSPLOWO2_01_FULL_49_10]
MKKGFTLIEVLVAATIIAVLVAIGMVSYGNINKRSRDSKRKSDLEQVRSALEMYRSDNNAYPAVNTGGFATAANLNTGNPATGLVSAYTPSIPTDPTSSQTYRFRAIAVSGSYVSYCLCGKLETECLSTSCTTCTVSLPVECNYGVKNP